MGNQWFDFYNHTPQVSQWNNTRMYFSFSWNARQYNNYYFQCLMVAVINGCITDMLLKDGMFAKLYTVYMECIGKGGICV